MSRRSVALLVVLALGLLLVAQRVWIHLEHEALERPPHIVLLIIDTLRADRLGCYGDPRNASPEIDALAAGGTRFARTVSQSPWTRPSVASLMTSRHPRSLGIYREKVGVLGDRFETLPESLRSHGYRTFGATANPHLNRSFNFGQGFDEYLDSTQVWSWMDGSQGHTPTFSPRVASARKMFEQAIVFLDSESSEQARAPHFLQFDAMEVHETWSNFSLVRREFGALFPDVEYTKERRYLQAIRQISSDLQWFVDSLAERPGWEDVVYVVVSDHGEGLDSHPNVEDSEFHGTLLYESQLVVPWILYSTRDRVPRGRVIERPVRLLEVMPTLLGIVGIEVPPGVQGQSLVPLLRQTGNVALPAEFVIETEFKEASKVGAYGAEFNRIENRDELRGVHPIELQPVRISEDGIRTDVGLQQPEELDRLGRVIRQWERDFPRVPETLSASGPSELEHRQLEALGYVD